MTAARPGARSALRAERAGLRVAWVGEKPAWLTLAGAAAELKADDLDAVLPDSVRAHDLLRLLAAAPEVLQVGRAGLKHLEELRRAAPESALVLDLSGAGWSSLRRREAPQAAAADLILFGSLWELREFRTRHPSLAARTGLVRRPIDLEEHAPEELLLESKGHDLRRFRRFYRLGRPTVLFAGPYTEAGGLDLALEAVYAIRERSPDIRLAAIPHGPIEQRYLDRCERRALGLGHRGVVEWSPQGGEIPFWYAVADVVCMPCRGPAGAESAALAAAAGRPFVGSEVEPLLEHVVNGETGFLLPIGDLETLTAALEALVGDEDEAGRLGAAARQRAERELSPAAAARQLRRLWAEAIDARRAQPEGNDGRA